MIKDKIIYIIIIIIILSSVNLYKRISTDKLNRNLIDNSPKISVIIPIYNGGKYLNYSLKSVMTQNMKNIEIIIVDDNSDDDSLQIIRNFMKTDSRIKLIENKENRRILFCKSFGALNSKGKYIVELDQDDMLIRNDAFDIIYNEAEKNKLDLLGFKTISNENLIVKRKYENYINNYDHIEKQPNLKSTQFKNRLYILWGNLINADLYKKIIYNLWPIIINYKIIFQEDFLITFFILIFAQKYKNIKDEIYFHLINKNSASNGHKNNSEYYLSVVFAGIIFYDYYIDYFPQDIQLIMNYINYEREEFKVVKILYPNLFNFFFGKILSNNQLTFENKKYLEKELNITQKYDSYIYLNISQNYFINEFSKQQKNISPQEIKFLKISIIITISNFKKMIKILNSIINNYIKSCSSIQLIVNCGKKGKLFSVSKGIMMAKGKYLILLEENSFFIDKDALKNIYDEIEKQNVDILEFDLYKILPNNYIYLYKCKHFLTQFDITKIKYNLKYKEIDIHEELITNKLINANFLKNIIIKYNINEINNIIDKYYNKIFHFLIQSTPHLFNRTNSVKLYKNHLTFEKITFNDFSTKETRIINETIFYINFIFDNSKDNFEIKENILNEFFNVLSIIFNKYNQVSEESLKLFNKFINCMYISEKNKNMLKFYFNSLIN